MQHSRAPTSTALKKNFEPPFPMLIIKQEDKPRATGTTYSDALASNNESKPA